MRAASPIVFLILLLNPVFSMSAEKAGSCRAGYSTKSERLMAHEALMELRFSGILPGAFRLTVNNYGQLEALGKNGWQRLTDVPCGYLRIVRKRNFTTESGPLGTAPDYYLIASNGKKTFVSRLQEGVVTPLSPYHPDRFKVHLDEFVAQERANRTGGIRIVKIRKVENGFSLGLMNDENKEVGHEKLDESQMARFLELMKLDSVEQLLGRRRVMIDGYPAGSTSEKFILSFSNPLVNPSEL